ncbi:MAG: DMT family transporter [Clostridia bacterium]|nr:DMT family transporter [Clostridia bacterium]
MQKASNRDRVLSTLSLIVSMLIFGTIGVLKRRISLSPGVIAGARGFIGSFLLFSVLFVKRAGEAKREGRSIRLFGKAKGKTLLLLALSGAAIGLNWVLLFFAYDYTTVAVATLSYYMQPTFLVLASALLFRDRFGKKQVICAALSFFGMVLVSGVVPGNETPDLRGILFGLSAACLYTAVVLLNRFLTEADAMEKTVIQLFFAALVTVPYVLLTEGVPDLHVPLPSLLWLLTLGVLHTGVAYLLFFRALPGLSGQTVAVLSYVDPITAVLLSALFLSEPFTVYTALGAVLIVGAAVAGEITLKKGQDAG